MFRPVVVGRIFFVLLSAACGYWLARGNAASPTPQAYSEAINTAVVAFVLSLLMVVFEYSLRTVSYKRLFLASLGLLFGLVVSLMVYGSIPPSVIQDPRAARIVCNFLFGYLGMIIALKHADQINLSSLRFIVANPDGAQAKILDTSVIIDGRIREMLPMGFVPGNILVPTFVIDELQMLADSSDMIKRGKGRRGLGILEALQQEYSSLQVVEKNYPDLPDVDRKLLEMAKETNAQIITNDFNLQKVASLHKVHVLNLNELADMLKPPVFVGETFTLNMIREGKEAGQGVGYLDDGTMVVVDDGRQFLNREIEVVVTSILQTNTGRMVFARPLTNSAAGQPVATGSGKRASA
ncbi:hypothetical protein JW916_08090 [Candidatus Sumerlaeota bacterium]|nr:hypothetical protein [Candidatus Sumerlaeota bacterium]